MKKRPDAAWRGFANREAEARWNRRLLSLTQPWKPPRREHPDAAWKRRQLDYLEKDFERFSHWRNATEAERQEARERRAKWCDHMIAVDWVDLDRQRREAAKRRGTLLAPNATDTERLFVLATRLGVVSGETRRYFPGGDLYGEDIPEDFWALIDMALAQQQPEFASVIPDRMSGPGRPKGQPNKQIRTDVTKEAVRQRRRRLNKQKRDNILHNICSLPANPV
jgi:hypothetical protein